MKKIVVVFAGVVLVLMVMLVFRNSKDIEIIKNEEYIEEGNYIFKDYASLKNRSEINFIIDGASYTNRKLNFRIGDTLKVVMPLDVMTEMLNCSIAQYPDGRVNIAKGDTVIELNIDSDKALVNDKKVELGGLVYKEDDVVYVPVDNILEYINYKEDVDLIKEKITFAKLGKEYDLPSSYDMRETDRVTVVRDQGKYGTCWAFAALSAVETSMMPEERLLLSPEHMSKNNSFNLDSEEGGEYAISIAYLASWQGPVLEKDDPYGDGKTNSNLQAVKHLEEAIILKKKDFYAIKNSVFRYGAVETSIYTMLDGKNISNSYYNSENCAYYYDGDEKANHDILIVGWDDNYPKENFSKEPAADGAFICKNSWGTDFGEDGYFYISYYDTIIGDIGVVYSKIGKKDNYDNIYQSDLLGWTGQLGYGSGEAYFANAYTAKSQETIEAVGFYSIDDNSSYTVYAVPKFNDVKDFSSKIEVASGELRYAGYHTVNLDNGIDVDAGQKYAMVVYINTPGIVHPIAIEYEADDRTANFDIEDGEGYISMSGNAWVSAEKKQECNVCLKVFTKDR